ncbi:hypothetical protein [Sporosarcina sp. Te-1]|uniref:hypothetical protein n=1 Tax=Sporosarcina sp. Te-1 TaxID=2818390 RepID=UPI001A9D1067|nr:hypothetical protein [Sporosarcina sp. Te-1]QTD40118.1 hypothetical protein J3U78_14990 [Sporosarcina sp. Te-1]
MEIVVYGLIGLYALLTCVAGVQKWRGEGFQMRAALFIAVSVGMLATLCMPGKGVVLSLLVLEFALLHVLALAEGAGNGRIRAGHHFVRLFFHCLLLFLVYQYIK